MSEIHNAPNIGAKPVAKIDSLKVRQHLLMSGQKIRCAYPGCQIQFHPDERTAKAYLKKGYCYCHYHHALPSREGNGGNRNGTHRSSMPKRRPFWEERQKPETKRARQQPNPETRDRSVIYHQLPI